MRRFSLRTLFIAVLLAAVAIRAVTFLPVEAYVYVACEDATDMVTLLKKLELKQDDYWVCNLNSAWFSVPPSHLMWYERQILEHARKNGYCCKVRYQTALPYCERTKTNGIPSTMGLR